MANSGQIVNNFVGDSGSGGVKGTVPAPAALDGPTKRKFLQADGTWSAQNNTYSSRAEALSAIATFTQRSTVANQWYGVCYSPDLNLFVSVSSSGTDRILISKDGVSWRNITAPAAVIWAKIIWAKELGLFVACASTGSPQQIMTSPDGLTWTLRTSVTGQWYDICYSPQLKLLVCVGLGGGSVCMTSPDGITWTTRSIGGTTTNAYTVCWSNLLSLFVAIRLNGAAYTSPDGINWTIRTISDKSWQSVTWAEELGLFVAVGLAGTNRCATSPDGITWTDRTISSVPWRRVAWSAELGMMVAVASGGQLAYSYDGITWASGTAPESTNQWFDITWSKQLGAFVIVGITGTSRVMTSKFIRAFEKGFNPNFNVPFTTSSAAISAGPGSVGNTIVLTSAVAVTVTAPDFATFSVPVGSKIKYVRAGAGTVTFVAGAGATLVSRGGLLSINGQYGVVELEKIAINSWLLSGDLV